MHPSSHVDALLHIALTACPDGAVIWDYRGVVRVLTVEAASRAGRVLLAANADSVNAATGLSDMGSGFDSGGVFTYFEYLDEASTYGYHLHVTRPDLSPSQALGALAGLMRQCESWPGWDDSEARAIAVAMEQAFLRLLPGFDDHSSITYPLPESRVEVSRSVLEEF